jgi:hypothetical protein
MKHSFLLLLTFCTFSFFSCSYSKGVKKDLATGLLASYNGFSIDDAYLTDANDKRLANNKISFGTPLAVIVTGVENFEEKNGRVFPGCTILLTDKTGKEILNLPDAFAEMKEGTTAAEAKQLQAKLNTGNPMVIGETYHLYVRFYDKNKKESEIILNTDLLMKE